MLIFARRRDHRGHDGCEAGLEREKKRNHRRRSFMVLVTYALSLLGKGFRLRAGVGVGVIYGDLNGTSSLICGSILFPFNTLSLFKQCSSFYLKFSGTGVLGKKNSKDWSHAFLKILLDLVGNYDIIQRTCTGYDKR